MLVVGQEKVFSCTLHVCVTAPAQQQGAASLWLLSEQVTCPSLIFVSSPCQLLSLLLTFRMGRNLSWRTCTQGTVSTACWAYWISSLWVLHSSFGSAFQAHFLSSSLGKALWPSVCHLISQFRALLFCSDFMGQMGLLVSTCSQMSLGFSVPLGAVVLMEFSLWWWSSAFDSVIIQYYPILPIYLVRYFCRKYLTVMMFLSRTHLLKRTVDGFENVFSFN